MDADLLIILSDVDGLYNGNPRVEKNVEKIDRVEKITPEIEALAGGSGSKLGTGGMQTKLAAAKIASNSGIVMVLGPAYRDYVLLEIVEMLEKGNDYSIGTTFLPGEKPLSKRKHWFVYNPTVYGRLIVDEGAEKALLEKGKSLLPGGILAVEGDFQQGDPVEVLNKGRILIGKGLSNYSAREIELIRGQHSRKISSILGYSNGPDVIHRDNLAICKG